MPDRPKEACAAIVEDFADDAELIPCSRFGQAGYAIVHRRVQTAKSMRQTLEETSWDLVISDYSMPAQRDRRLECCSKAESTFPSSSSPEP